MKSHVIHVTAQKMKFSIKDFSSTCEQIRSFLQIWSHLLEKSLMKNFIFGEVCGKSMLQSNGRKTLCIQHIS